MNSISDLTERKASRVSAISLTQPKKRKTVPTIRERVRQPCGAAEDRDESDGDGRGRHQAQRDVKTGQRSLDQLNAPRVDRYLAFDFNVTLFWKIGDFVPGKLFYDAAQFAHAVNHARKARRC